MVQQRVEQLHNYFNISIGKKGRKEIYSLLSSPSSLLLQRFCIKSNDYNLVSNH